MTDLERRALLGDAEAQRECTEKGIVLRCPCCGCDDRDMLGLSVYHEQYFYSCESCGCNGPIVYDSDNCDYPEHEALTEWNTRPVPPIGRCASCACWDENTCECESAADIEVAYHKYTEPDFFCGDYEPKED